MLLRALPIVLAGVLASGILLFGASHVARYQVTSDRLYLDALQAADVYERAYLEVAADPALARLVDPFFGNEPWARALTVSTLRLVFPPQSLSRGTEKLVSEWTAYLRGERDDWPPPIRADEVRAELLEGVTGRVSARVAAATGMEVTSAEAFRLQVEAFLADLVDGRVPTVVPDLPPLPQGEALRIATLVLARAPDRPPPGAREQVAAFLEAGDTHGALALVTPYFIDPAVRQALRGWRERLEAGSLGGALRGFEDRGVPLTTRISSVRSAVRWLGAPLALFSGLMAFGALAAFVWLIPRAGGSPVRWLGGTLAVTGLVGAAILVVGAREVELALAERMARLPPEVPGSVVALLRDIAAQMVAGLGRSNMPVTAALIVTGVALLVSHPPAALVHLRRSTDRTRRALVLAGGMLTGAVVLTAAEIWGERARGDVMLCNGDRALCAKRLDEVVFAGTHNSMSAASLGWIFPNQDRWIDAQLESGYRALLIDAHYWGGAASIQRHLSSFPPEYRTAALGALARATPPRPGVFLCHGVCGLGATPLATGLAAIVDFLRRNPHEVVIISIEDYVTPEDVAEAFRTTGLLEFVYDPEGSDRWPTLREMIESGQRVVVFADHRGGDPSWYLPFGTYMQDTPANVRSVEGLGCRHNRGDPEAGLLLLNHWISALPPDRVSAFRVNRRASLLAHAERCRRERGVDPNIIAVDFASSGDVLTVVSELNARDD